MPPNTGNNDKNHNPRKRRSNWAAVLEPHVRGGKDMTDQELEEAVLQMLGKSNR